ncbi:MAG: MogA/MoaB family molybdenum cofactor biosynthesis protein [Actinomycetaceae bacterium]|nr:MogA/MoaB family molybdenum cofactor biosynthesis protein [Actinomycetaceae bacterium]
MAQLDAHDRIEQKGLQPLRHQVKGAVITVSDRCISGEREDKSGPLAVKLLAKYNVDADVRLVPDGIDSVQKAIHCAIADGARIVVTSGGTGVTPRDLTPEATQPLVQVRLDGIAHQIREYGLKNTPLASLSRGIVGITQRGSKGVLIVNAPGSRGGVKDTIAVVGPLIPHILEQFDPETFEL